MALLYREHGKSNASFYKWWATYGSIDALLISLTKSVEDESRRLKMMFTEVSKQNEVLKAALEKNDWAISAQVIRPPTLGRCGIPSDQKLKMAA